MDGKRSVVILFQCRVLCFLSVFGFFDDNMMSCRGESMEYVFELFNNFDPSYISLWGL